MLIRISCAVAFALALTAVTARAELPTPMYGCKDKDGRAVRAEGKSFKEKEAFCKKAGGAWEKLRMDQPAVTAAPAATQQQAPAAPSHPQQSSGGGGGW